jgi:hypothetical protein
MTRDDGMAQLYRLSLLRILDGARPSEALEWVSPVAPAVTQAAIGAGHWAAGRRRRALAAWTTAAGFGLMAWGLGAEAATKAEVEENFEQEKDRLRKLGLQVPATAARTDIWMTRQPWRSVLDVFGPSMSVVFGVRSGLRRPRRLTVPAIAAEAPAVVFCALRAARAGQRRRPRIAVGSALVVAGSVARLRAASAEPLR